jgi:hypothetical protein
MNKKIIGVNSGIFPLLGPENEVQLQFNIVLMGTRLGPNEKCLKSGKL